MSTLCTLTQAAALIGSSNKTTITIEDEETVAGPLTIPSNVNLRFVDKGQITVSSGTVTLNCTIEAPPRKIFSCSSGGVVFGENVFYAFPEWFGAVRDGVTDDRAAINTTIAAMQTGTLKLLPGNYAISDTITIPATSIINIEGAGKDTENGSGSILLTNFSAENRVLDVYSFFRRYMKNFGILYNSGSYPSAYIHVKNSTSPNLHVTGSQFEKISITGGDKAYSIGISIGEGETHMGDNLSFRDLSLRILNVGCQLCNDQVVGIVFEKVHLVKTTYGLVFTNDIADPDSSGAGLIVGNGVQHTNLDDSLDTVIFIRSAGQGCCYSFTNLTTEADAVLVDAGVAVGNGDAMTVNVIGGRTSTTTRTVPIYKVGPGCHLNGIGGRHRMPALPGVVQFEVIGTLDEGDAFLNLDGCYLDDIDELVIDTGTYPMGGAEVEDGYGFYKIQNCFSKTKTGSISRLVSNLVVDRNAYEYMHPMIKAPSAEVGHIVMPLHSNDADSDANMRRYLPPGTKVTKVSFYISATTATTGTFKLRMPFTGTAVDCIDATQTGYREITINNAIFQSADPGAVTGVTLSHANLVGGLTGSEIVIQRSDDDCCNVTGEAVVEYVFENAKVRFDVSSPVM